MLYALTDLYEFGYTTYKDLMEKSILCIPENSIEQAQATVSSTNDNGTLISLC